MTFEEWLITKKDKDSPLGDLAQDFIRDGKPTPFTKAYLKERYVHRDALSAYIRAKSSYNQWVKRRKEKLING